MPAYRAIYGETCSNADDVSISGRAGKILKNPLVEEFIRQADERFQEDIEASLADIGVSKQRIALELATMGLANMSDFMKVDAFGQPQLDWRGLTRSQAAALQEVTVDTYVEGRGDNATPVRKVKFKLADKRASLESLAKLLGMTAEKDAPPPPVALTVNFVNPDGTNAGQFQPETRHLPSPSERFEQGILDATVEEMEEATA